MRRAARPSDLYRLSATPPGPTRPVHVPSGYPPAVRRRYRPGLALLAAALVVTALAAVILRDSSAPRAAAPDQAPTSPTTAYATTSPSPGAVVALYAAEYHAVTEARAVGGPSGTYLLLGLSKGLGRRNDLLAETVGALNARRLPDGPVRGYVSHPGHLRLQRRLQVVQETVGTLAFLELVHAQLAHGADLTPGTRRALRAILHRGDSSTVWWAETLLARAAGSTPARAVAAARRGALAGLRTSLRRLPPPPARLTLRTYVDTLPHSTQLDLYTVDWFSTALRALPPAPGGPAPQ